MDFLNENVHNDRPTAREASLYTIANSDYFEPLESIATIGDYRNHLRRALPCKWTLKKAGLWYHALPPSVVLPASGFKLHISATVDNAKQILSIVVPICIEQNVSFKVLRASNLLSLVNSKLFPRGAAHKFITIYPTTTDQFLALANTLDVMTKSFIGPYILSDKPVNGSKTVFYRFGGFRFTSRLTTCGTKELVIQAPDGAWKRDERVPNFRLPYWVHDPLCSGTVVPPSGPVILNLRYQVKEALSFSNCGGTYVAVDLNSGEEVLLKEARPLTTLSHKPSWRFYASDTLLREQRILNKLESLTCVPKHIECFEEGGHTFTAQQLISARPFRRYRAQDNITLTPFDGDNERANCFRKAFGEIALNLIKSVFAVHRHQIIIGDISPDNILVDAAQNVYLIDFESAWDRSWALEPDELATVWMTRGFRCAKRETRSKVTYRDDWFAAGMILFSMLLPVEQLSVLTPGSWENFLNAIARAARLPSWIEEVIRSLIAARPRAALKLLERNCQVPTKRLVWHYSEVNHVEEHQERDAILLMNKAADTVTSITHYILKTYDVKRRDCLWPSDFQVFSTNPLSIAYGACGPLLFLRESGTEVPHEINKWLLAQPLVLTEYTPGLYLGLSGIAYALWQLGHEDEAIHALSMAFKSDMLYADWSMFYGAAGCGLVSLQMYLWTKDERFVKSAIEVGTHIVGNAVDTDYGVAWPEIHGEISSGFACGGSGIALFLLYLSIMVRDKKFLVAAKKALEHEIASASRDDSDRLLRWKSEGKRNIWSPYWLEGGCGIGSVVIRFYMALKETRYLSLAQDIARANYSRFAVLPAQFEGLSGIGEFMLDMSMLTGNEEFDIKAQKIVESILLYRIPKGRGTAFPGRFLMRLSNDYGYGSSGIGIFLNRFLHRKRRLLHDLDG
jgi:serine/threonine protein kinase